MPFEPWHPHILYRVNFIPAWLQHFH